MLISFVGSLTGLTFMLTVCGEALAQRPRPGGRLVEDLRIESRDSDSLVLTAVADIEVGPDGHVYVILPDERTVRVFDHRGQSLQRIGTRGSGPGEFQWPMRLGWKQDTLWVWDPTTARVSLFSRRGTFMRSIPVGTVGSTRLLADGSIAIKRYDEDAVRSASGRLSAPLLLYTSAGRIVDTLVDITVVPTGPLLIPMGRGMAQAQQPFSAIPLWATFPDGRGVVLVRRDLANRPGPAIYTVTRFGLRGDTAFSRAFSYTAAAVSDAAIEAIVDSWVERLKRHPGPGGTSPVIDRTVIRRAIDRPETTPPISELVLGRDGTIWLRREDATPSREATWLLLDDRGHSIGEVRAPKEVQLFRADQRNAWGVARDDDGVPVIVRYRIER